MELFETLPLKEKKAIGRTPIHTHETRLMIGRQVVNRELSYSKASLAYGISEGSVGACVNLFKQTERGERKAEKRAERQVERSGALTEYHHQTQVKQLKHEIAELYLESHWFDSDWVHHAPKFTFNRSKIIFFSARSVHSWKLHRCIPAFKAESSWIEVRFSSACMGRPSRHKIDCFNRIRHACR